MPELKILITETPKKETLFIALADNKPLYLAREKEKTGGMICVGRVENCLQNLKAAFVRFADREIGYLPFASVPPGALLNRAFGKEDRLKPGDLLLVQTQSAAKGTKQARLTGYLTLHGTYAVLGFEKQGIGCAASLEADLRRTLVRSFRQELAHAVDRTHCSARGADDGDMLLPDDFREHFGVILRTSCGALYARFLAQGKDGETAARETAKDVLAEVRTLFSRMKALSGKADTRQPGTVLFAPDADAEANERLMQVFHFLERACKDVPVEIVCASERLMTRALKAECATRETVRVRVNEEADALYGVAGILEKLTHRVVWLKSGAYLVIEETEAMTVVDVNSGKYIAKKDDDFLKVNLEAAEAVMRELRLRDLTGIVVVDFINMREGETVSALKECLCTLASLDPVHTRFHGMTALGLAEITRTAH